MEPDLGPAGDGGLSLLDPLVDRILVDTVSQQQGWLRVYGRFRWFRFRSQVRAPDLDRRGLDLRPRLVQFGGQEVYK